MSSLFGGATSVAVTPVGAIAGRPSLGELALGLDDRRAAALQQQHLRALAGQLLQRRRHLGRVALVVLDDELDGTAEHAALVVEVLDGRADRLAGDDAVGRTRAGAVLVHPDDDRVALGRTGVGCVACRSCSARIRRRRAPARTHRLRSSFSDPYGPPWFSGLDLSGFAGCWPRCDLSCSVARAPGGAGQRIGGRSLVGRPRVGDVASACLCHPAYGHASCQASQRQT